MHQQLKITNSFFYKGLLVQDANMMFLVRKKGLKKMLLKNGLGNLVKNFLCCPAIF